MKPISEALQKKNSLGAAIVVLMSLSFAGSAWGIYLNDAAKEAPAGVYHNPGDGFCVSGIKTDGTMTVVPGITNFRDCVAYTTGLTGMTATDVTALSTCSTAGVAPFDKPCNVAANCARPEGYLTWVPALQKCFDNSACTIQGAVGNDLAKHAYSTSLCINPVTRAGISRVDLDNTAANCQEKGGVLADGLYGHPYGACSAYGWQYGGVKSNGSLPTVGTKGVTSADNLGFCYASMRMTSVAGYSVEGTGSGCPSWHNAVAKAGAEWTAGTDNVKYQSQASYDAGLGWSFASSQCLYQYSVKGYLNADLRGPDGLIPAAVPLCTTGTGAATTGTCVDLTGYTTQGDCLAIGGTWDNWLPVGTGAAPYATNVTVPTTVNSTIKKLDATTLIAAGGGKFFSGTGSVCLKCHSDQSRQTMERYKPGFVETPHKLAGDTPEWGTIGAPWGLKGVQCEICHATGKATAQDLGTIIYQTKVCVGGTVTAATPCTSDAVCGTGGVCTAGVPRGASGHNQTEYGTHVTGVCITCHGTPTTPATAIPVVAGDFAPTAKNLAPIANEFLNSPHAKYTGTSNKLDVITKTNYGSTFLGNICRGGSEVTDAATTTNGVDVTAAVTCGAASNLICNATNCPLTPGGNRIWNFVTSKCYDKAVCEATPSPGKSWDTVTKRCVETQATCTPQTDSGYNFIWSPTGVAGNPSIITTSGAGCYKAFGNGTIYATYYDTATSTAKRIPFLDSATNVACTSPTLGAGAFWIPDGEAAGTTTVNSVPFLATDKGNCMTCHDVHWSLESTDPEAEPLRRECTTCHENSGTSASGAPQINLATINHQSGLGTPIADPNDPDAACETCHMPKSARTAGSSPMHLWRISTDPTYVTMGGPGATSAATAADGSYTDAAWVDIDHACGQCHGGGLAQGPGYQPVPPALYRTRATLAPVALGMHASSGVNYAATFSTSINVLTVNVDATVDCGTDAYGNILPCPAFTYDWNWGDATAHGSDDPATHTYTAGGKYDIKLTLALLSNGQLVGPPVTRGVILTAPNQAPSATGTCSFNADTWTMTVTDNSSDPDDTNLANLSVVVDWGDGGAKSSVPKVPRLVSVSRAYTRTGTFFTTVKATDIKGASSSYNCLVAYPTGVTPAYFSIAGTVKTGLAVGIPGALVTLKKGAGTVASTATAADGTYSFSNLKPAKYSITVTKSGYGFGPAPQIPTITVGASKTGQDVTALTTPFGVMRNSEGADNAN
jgi:hypothetical protein